MNVTVHIPGIGLVEFGPTAARAAAAFLADHLPHVPDTDHPAYMRAIRDLEHAADPAAHFDTSCYVMPGAKAGWERDS